MDSFWKRLNGILYDLLHDLFTLQIMSFISRFVNIFISGPIWYIIEYVAMMEIMKVTVSGKTYYTYFFGFVYMNLNVQGRLPDTINIRRVLYITDKSTKNYILLIDDGIKQFDDKFYDIYIFPDEDIEFAAKSIKPLLRTLDLDHIVNLS